MIFGAVYNQRLKTHRWVIGVAAVVFAVLFFSGTVSALVSILSVAIIIAASMFAPIGSVQKKAKHIKQSSNDMAEFEQVHAILNAVPDPIFLINKNGMISFINDESGQIFSNLTVGTQIWVRFRDPEFQSMVRKAIKENQVQIFDYVEGGAPERWFAVSLRPCALSGTDQHYMVHFRDLSETRRIEKVRSDFIANASHELRTPLASLTGFIETLAGPARDDAVARDQFLKIMQEQAERMSRLIDDLLTLSRFETARGQADFAPISLKPILAHVSDALKPMAQSAGTVIELINSDEAADYSIFGNRDELIQLFENLVENAIKYGANGGSVKIELGSAGIEDIIITVKDHGPGIAEEHIPRLVERFYRVDVDTSRGKQGTGLGLSIVKHIIQRHKGRLNIKSELGKGTDFIVTLPINSD